MAVLKRPSSDHPLEELLEKLQPRIKSVLARFRVPFEDAEDLLQQTLLTFLHKRESVHDPERWILGTLRNRCLMYWRARRRQLYRNVDTALLESFADPRRPAQENTDLRRDLDSVIAQISPRCQTLLSLRYELGCEPPEAAERLGYKKSGIYKVLERCLAALTRELVASGLVEESGGG